MSITKRGNPILTMPSQKVDNVEAVKPIISELSDTLTEIQKLYNFQRGSGISAPQIGHLHRISIVDYGGKRQVLINPVIVQHSPDKVPIREGCLSFFDYRGTVPRYSYVVVEALDENGKRYTIDAADNFAMLLQHEIDHLDGILYVERLSNSDADLYLIEGMPVIP